MNFQASILNIIRQKPFSPTHDIGEQLGIGQKNAYKLLAAMRDEGLIEWRRQGSYMAGWQVPQEPPPIRRTLHRRKILSLFNPVEFA